MEQSDQGLTSCFILPASFFRPFYAFFRQKREYWKIFEKIPIFLLTILLMSNIFAVIQIRR